MPTHAQVRRTLPRGPPVRQRRDRNAEQLGDVHSVQQFHHPYEAVDGDEISRPREVISEQAVLRADPCRFPNGKPAGQPAPTQSRGTRAGTAQQSSISPQQDEIGWDLLGSGGNQLDAKLLIAAPHTSPHEMATVSRPVGGVLSAAGATG